MKQCFHIKMNVLPFDREVKSEISNNCLKPNITLLLIMFFESHILKLGTSKKLQNLRKIIGGNDLVRPRTFSFPYIFMSSNYRNSTICLRKVIYKMLCLQGTILWHILQLSLHKQWKF